jgi:hypothetical protein
MTAKKARRRAPRLFPILVVDDALNCTFPLYGVTQSELHAIFGKGRDIAFIDEVNQRLGGRAGTILSRVWERPMLKHRARGIHGTLFYLQNSRRLESAMRTWPTRRECEVFPSAIPYQMREMFERERRRRGLPSDLTHLGSAHDYMRPLSRKRRAKPSSAKKRRRDS